MQTILTFALLLMTLSTAACTQAGGYGNEWESMKYSDYAASGMAGSLPMGK